MHEYESLGTGHDLTDYGDGYSYCGTHGVLYLSAEMVATGCYAAQQKFGETQANCLGLTIGSAVSLFLEKHPGLPVRAIVIVGGIK